MSANAISDAQHDSSAGVKSGDITGQILAQNVFRTKPSDYLNAIQRMTAPSDTSNILQPMPWLSGNDSSSNSSASHESESGVMSFSPQNLASDLARPSDNQSFAFTTDGNKITSSAGLPFDTQTSFPSESNSIQISNLPESNSGQNGSSSEVVSGSQSAIPSESSSGQTAVASDTSSSGLESNAGPTAVSPESTSAAGDASSALTPNSSFDQMPQINQNSNDGLTQFENQIISEIEQLFQMLERRRQASPEPCPEPTPEPNPEPTPNPTPAEQPLKGDVNSFTAPNAGANSISYKTADGETKTASMPQGYNGSGTFMLYSDGVLAYSGSAGTAGGAQYLDDSKNPPQWVNYDGQTSTEQHPAGTVEQSVTVGGQLQYIKSPDVSAKTMLVQSTDGYWQSIPTPPDYNGTGQFTIFSNGVLGYTGASGEFGGQCFYDQSIDPPGWVNDDGPNPGPNAPAGIGEHTWTAGFNGEYT